MVFKNIFYYQYLKCFVLLNIYVETMIHFFFYKNFNKCNASLLNKNINFLKNIFQSCFKNPTKIAHIHFHYNCLAITWSSTLCHKSFRWSLTCIENNAAAEILMNSKTAFAFKEAKAIHSIHIHWFVRPTEHKLKHELYMTSIVSRCLSLPVSWKHESELSPVIKLICWTEDVNKDRQGQGWVLAEGELCSVQ